MHPGHPDNPCASIMEDWEQAMLEDMEQPQFRTLSGGRIKDCYTGFVYDKPRSTLDDPETPYDKTHIATNQPVDA